MVLYCFELAAITYNSFHLDKQGIRFKTKRQFVSKSQRIILNNCFSMPETYKYAIWILKCLGKLVHYLVTYVPNYLDIGLYSIAI